LFSSKVTWCGCHIILWELQIVLSSKPWLLSNIESMRNTLSSYHFDGYNFNWNNAWYKFWNFVLFLANLMENNCYNYNKENKYLIVMYIIYLDITELILSNQWLSAEGNYVRPIISCSHFSFSSYFDVAFSIKWFILCMHKVKRV